MKNKESGLHRPYQIYPFDALFGPPMLPSDLTWALLKCCSNAAVWNCFRAKCGWNGTTRVAYCIVFVFTTSLSFTFRLRFFNCLMLLQAFAEVKSSYNRMIKLPKVKNVKEITERDLKLEPLCSDVNFLSPILILFSLKVKSA